MKATWLLLRNKLAQVKPGTAALVFFAAYLLLGILLFDDYGVSTDEIFQIDKSRITLDYVLGRNDDLLSYADRHYGALFPLILQSANSFFTDTRAIFLYRHLATFLFFYFSTVAFYFLLRRLRFNGWIALCGTAMLIFHPHIFAHSYYNPKDIPFLSMWVYALLSLAWWSEKPGCIWRACLHGLVTGLLVVFRLPGVMMWAISGLVMLVLVIMLTTPLKKAAFAFGAFLVASFGALYIFLPTLWHNPIGEFITFLSMSPFEWTGKELFMGQFYKVDKLPAYHWLVYFILTTPLLYHAFFLLGTGGWVARIRRADPETMRLAALRLLPLGLSVLILLATHPKVYNGWRHVLFLYPMFVILALDGLVLGWQFLRRAFPIRWAGWVLVSSLGMQALVLAAFLIQSHPYEFTYYNWLAGRKLSAVRNDYIMDYWGLAYTEAFMRIAQMDDRAEIKVETEYLISAEQNLMMVPADMRARIKLIPQNSDERFDYYISTFREYVPIERKNMKLVDSITVRDLTVAGIYTHK